MAERRVTVGRPGAGVSVARIEPETDSAGAATVTAGITHTKPDARHRELSGLVIEHKERGG